MPARTNNKNFRQEILGKSKLQGCNLLFVIDKNKTQHYSKSGGILRDTNASVFFFYRKNSSHQME